MASFDPITVELLNNQIAVIGEEMAATISRTARSPMVRGGDFSAILLDADGSVLGQGYAAPIQLPLFMNLMRFLSKKFGGDIHPGDVFVSNDPYQGWSHMPDIGVVLPIFWAGGCIGFAASYSHHTDIGGRFPGGMSSHASTSYEEGLRLPILRLSRQGAVNDMLLQTILANVRGPGEWLADLDAKIAGCRRGAVQLGEVLDHHGIETFDHYRRYTNEYSESSLRTAIRGLPDGNYEVVNDFEDDGVGTPGAVVRLALTISVNGESLVADFDGTAAQLPTAINLPVAQTELAVVAGLKLLVASEVQVNAGFLRPVQVHAPLGTVVNPRHPAAVGGRGSLGARVMNMMVRALALAKPDSVPVPGDGADALHLVGTGRREFVMRDSYFGGWGARPDKDGIDGVVPLEFGASYGVMPAEVIERDYPVVVERFEYLPDSGGPGHYRGALSTRRSWRFLAPASAMVRTSILQPLEGFDGGKAPPRSSTYVERADGSIEQSHDQMHWHVEVGEGDRMHHVMAGCPGHGDPMGREPSRVLDEVLDGKATIAGAERVYGVVVAEGTDPSVDVVATDLLRASVRARPQGPS